MAPKLPYFDPGATFECRRPILAGGRSFKRGDDFESDRVPPRILRKLYEQRQIAYPRHLRDRPDPLTISTGAAGDAFTERRDVEIPEDWRMLGWPRRKALGALLTGDPVKSAADAEAAITAELERRAAGV